MGDSTSAPNEREDETEVSKIDGLCPNSYVGKCADGILCKYSKHDWSLHVKKKRTKSNKNNRNVGHEPTTLVPKTTTTNQNSSVSITPPPALDVKKSLNPNAPDYIPSFRLCEGDIGPVLSEEERPHVNGSANVQIEVDESLFNSDNPDDPDSDYEWELVNQPCIICGSVPSYSQLMRCSDCIPKDFIESKDASWMDLVLLPCTRCGRVPSYEGPGECGPCLNMA